MECASVTGVLGIPVKIEYSGNLICTATQLFARMILDVPTSLASLYSNGLASIEADATVKYTKDALSVHGRDGSLVLQAQTWGYINPELCTWSLLDKEKVLRITLDKAEDNVGSWPHCLQSLSIAPPKATTPNESIPLMPILVHNKTEFIEKANERLRCHLEESTALRNAFSEAIDEQVNSIPVGPLGQRAFIFPPEEPRCLVHLVDALSVPVVGKLVRLSKEILGISNMSWPLSTADILRDDDDGGGRGTRFSLDNNDKSSNNELFSPILSSFLSCFLYNLALLEERQLKHGIEDLQSATACCGFGIGEYAAAVFSGFLSLSDALAVLQAHAHAVETFSSLEQRTGAVDGNTHPLVVAAVSAALTAVPIKTPRIRVYSGMSSKLYGNSLDIVKHFPRAVCTRLPISSRQEKVELALMQQGVVEFVRLGFDTDRSSGCFNSSANIYKEDDESSSSSEMCISSLQNSEDAE